MGTDAGADAAGVVSSAGDTGGRLEEDNGPVPSEPRCYTPCNHAYVDSEGNSIECSYDGLMEGCLDSASCIDGTCVPNNADVPAFVTFPSAQANNASDSGVSGGLSLDPAGACEKNVDCPDFQVCIENRCYSNCEGDVDCPAEKGCYRKACRTTCNSSDDSCSPSTHCSIVDGEHGYCLPLAEPPTQAVQKAEGTFEVSSQSLRFSNSHLSQVVSISNNAEVALKYTVKKVGHTEYTADGAEDIEKNSMPWMAIGEPGSAEKVDSWDVVIDAGGSVDLLIDNDPDGVPEKWEGVVAVSTPDLGEKQLRLEYARGADGRWGGTVYYFSQFGDANLADWQAERGSTEKLTRVGNAFIQRWGALRSGRMSLDEFGAVVTATVSGSWSWPSVQDICPVSACYLYTSPEGYGPYSDSLVDQPVPSGVTELPIAIDLEAKDSKSFVGRIASSESLQYAGDPAVTLKFSGDPGGCAGANDTACLALVDSFDATITVGGRFASAGGSSDCGEAEGFQLTKTPWLLTDFTDGASEDEGLPGRYKFECRDGLQPLGDAEPELVAGNLSVSGANPIRDGRSRVRNLRLVDGILVNQDVMYLLVQESFGAEFVGAEADLAAYGLVVLRRVQANLENDSFQGSKQAETRDQSKDLSVVVECSDAILGKVGSALSKSVSEVTSDELVALLLMKPEDLKEDPSAIAVPPSEVHYLCGETNRFDGAKGPSTNFEFDGTGEGDVSTIRLEYEPCPAGSPVTYFHGAVPTDLSVLGCQQPGESKGTCDKDLSGWLQSTLDQDGQTHPPLVEELTIYRCADGSQNCDDDRSNLRNGKIFYLPASPGIAFPPLVTAVADAFRYKTRFSSRDGTTLGFTPEVCPASGVAGVPYCYDVRAIEELKERISCLNAVYASALAGTRELATETWADLKAALSLAYSYSSDASNPLAHTDGFERLHAELLIMLGDEAYTNAFQSRFDLANSRLVSFEGSKFEPNGIDLSGVAGYEMYTLYQAAQYYDLVLERFFQLNPIIWASVRGSAADSVIAQEAVTSYFDRVLRASTQKSRAYSEIAKRYQSFYRPDLARSVVQRAFTGAYLESVVMAQLMKSVVNLVEPKKRPDIRHTIDMGARTYRAALSDMREVHKSITDETGYFGFPPDYVPFPALEPSDSNAFAVVMASAKQLSAVAAAKEELAISSDRSFETDAASFQSELARITNTYDSQLGDLCGTFVIGDAVYPAVTRYAYLDERAKTLGDPCGLMGNGSLFEASLTADAGRISLQQAKQEIENNIDRAELEFDLVRKECGIADAAKNARIKVEEDVSNWQTAIRTARAVQSASERALAIAGQISNLAKCSVGMSTDCPSGVVATGAYAAAAIVAGAAITIQDGLIVAAERHIDDLQRSTITIESDKECLLWQTQSEANIRKIVMDLERAKLEALKADYQARLNLGTIQKLRNQATRLMAEQDEALQLAINVEAARNDPNVRIYKNDAILNADRTFYAALKEAYRATKVFEYYTSQSYADLDRLPLVRLVSRGDFSLEAYLSDLDQAYSQFRETFGRPDDRVDTISVRDDVLKIPRVADNGQALRESERVALFRAAMADTRRLDASGYITIPFATNFEDLSPLTRNHKVSYIEAEIIGSNVGDSEGRVYLRQAGTGAVAAVGEGKNYYRFPERVAVVNPFFNGVRSYGAEVYRTDRLRDRPYVNTRWEFVFNQRDESVNDDIQVDSLTDIRLNIHYTDFTQL